MTKTPDFLTLETAPEVIARARQSGERIPYYLIVRGRLVKCYVLPTSILTGNCISGIGYNDDRAPTGFTGTLNARERYLNYWLAWAEQQRQIKAGLYKNGLD